jgi:hypothetical protein
MTQGAAYGHWLNLREVEALFDKYSQGTAKEQQFAAELALLHRRMADHAGYDWIYRQDTGEEKTPRARVHHLKRKTG